MAVAAADEPHHHRAQHHRARTASPLVTFEVDGKTYSDKQVGAVIVTSFGEIEVLAINVNAQTVTIMHGDQTLTLHAGQVIIK